MGKADMLADDEAPLRQDSDDAMQEERLWKGVGKNYTLYTEILGFNGFKIGTSWGRSGHVKFSVTMDKKY